MGLLESLKKQILVAEKTSKTLSNVESIQQRMIANNARMIAENKELLERSKVTLDRVNESQRSINEFLQGLDNRV